MRSPDKKIQPTGAAPFAVMLFAFIVVASPVMAQDNGNANDPEQRACKQEDLTDHLFKMVSFSEKPKRNEAMWVREFPFHYLSFHGGNAYATMAFNREFKDPKRIQSYLAPQTNKLYTLDKEGVLTMLENEKVKYLYRCIAVLKNHENYLPGDLILTGYTKRKKSELYKLYRRWY